MERQELERLKTWCVDKAMLWRPIPDTGILDLLDDAYEALFVPANPDYASFGDGDTGPAPAYQGPELESGIFNVVMHLVQLHAQTMSPADARGVVAGWLEEIAAGLRQYIQNEE